MKNDSPERLFFEDEPGTIWLDGGAERSLLFRKPRRTLTAQSPDAIAPLLAEVDAAAQEGHYIAGYLSYEAGHPLVGLPLERTAQDEPLAWFGIYDEPDVVDQPPDPGARLDDQPPDLAAPRYNQPPGLAARIEDLHFGLDEARYRRHIEAIKEYIRAGDAYQINFTDRLSFNFDGSPLALYAALRRRQRVPYGAFINTGTRHILSLSPELFFRRKGNRVITRPMKGTARRGASDAEDAAIAEALAADEKSRAENLMIVDLLRNDLSRVCRPGSVRVNDLFHIEKYETLIQMTSSVEGRLKEPADTCDILQALFPCGSVTGAPKRRAMEIIRKLEGRPRDVYCGAIGYLAPDRRAVFNVAIRTLILEEGRGWMGTGSGIVWDSDAALEYDECLLKGRFLIEPNGSGSKDAHGEDARHRKDVRQKEDARQSTPPETFYLIETMRWQEGGIALLDLHLERLQEAAAHFHIPCDEKHIRRAIARAAADYLMDADGDAGPLKVRLALYSSGSLNIDIEELTPWPDRTLRLVVRPQPPTGNPDLRRYKTNRRSHYENAYRSARAEGYDEVLFTNARGNVTEGSRTNIFIRNGDSYETPPQSSGLLPGVYRRHLLETLPRVRERALTAENVQSADAAYVCNALRGMAEARLVNE